MVHRWIMAAGWLAFFAGTFCFLLAMHAALDIVAPRYSSFTIVNGTLNEPASQDLDFGVTALREGKRMNNGIICVIIMTTFLGIILLVFFLHPEKGAPHETT